MQYRLDANVDDLEPCDVTALNGEVIIVDLRTADEFDAGHIPGAIAVSISAIDQGWRGDDARLPFITVCRTGKVARHAAQALRAHGRDAYAVRGGMLAWHAAGEPIVTNAGTPPIVT